MNQSNRRIFSYAVIAVVAVFALFGFFRGIKHPALQPEKNSPDQEFRYKEPVITLYVNETGEKKRIKFEEYIAGVVAAEMETDWPVEALAAQAILARTFTLYKIKYEGGARQHGTDASTSTEEFQAYDPGKINSRVRKAVNMTRGMVVRYRGRYVRAWFHSNAGGKTATAAEGLAFTKEPTPYIKVVSDPGQKVAPPEERNWSASFPIETVRSAVKSQTGIDPGNITSVAVVKRGPSGRATEIKMGNTVISGPSLRLGLGPERMLSTLIDRIEIRNGALYIAGRGRGHGVGMSQWGAYYLAKQGKSPVDIIRYYYRDVTFDKIWR